MTTYSDAARPFWREAYGGRPYRVERQKHPDPIVVNHLVVSWFGTIQPDRLAEVIEGCDDGLMARFWWFWPEPVQFDRAQRAPNLGFAIRSLNARRQGVRGRCARAGNGGGRTHSGRAAAERPAAWRSATGVSSRRSATLSGCM